VDNQNLANLAAYRERRFPQHTVTRIDTNATYDQSIRQLKIGDGSGAMRVDASLEFLRQQFDATGLERLLEERNVVQAVAEWKHVLITETGLQRRSAT
jgi:hypothetical protein